MNNSFTGKIPTAPNTVEFKSPPIERTFSRDDHVVAVRNCFNTRFGAFNNNPAAERRSFGSAFSDLSVGNERL